MLNHKELHSPWQISDNLAVSCVTDLQDYDLYAFTGWIPDRMRLNPEEETSLVDKDEIFHVLKDGIEQGHALVIAGTPWNASKRETRSVGLRRRHAYGVIEMCISDVGFPSCI